MTIDSHSVLVSMLEIEQMVLSMQIWTAMGLSPESNTLATSMRLGSDLPIDMQTLVEVGRSRGALRATRAWRIHSQCHGEFWSASQVSRVFARGYSLRDGAAAKDRYRIRRLALNPK